MLYIRADANQTIGSGHIMRCLAIAKVLKKLGEDSIFITSDKVAENLIVSHGFSLVCLNTQWNDLDHEIQIMSKLIKENRIEKIIIDFYYVSNKYMESISKYAKVVYIDDLGVSVYPVDMLINYNINADKLDYQKKYLNTKLLIGTDYVPLRAEFLGKRHQHNDVIRDILISTGGSDSYNIAGTLIQRIRECPFFDGINIHIVVGAFNTHKELLLNLSKKYSGIILHQNVTNMATLIVNCDLAITAGGTTLYELCVCGVPCIVYTFADNQVDCVVAFHNYGLMYNAGDMRYGMESCIRFILLKAKELMGESKTRRDLASKMMQLIDGEGASRIANKILIL